MPPTKLGHQPFYSDNPTSIPSSRMPKPSFRNYGKGLGLSIPISPRERVDQHTFRCSPPELPFTDSPLSGPLLWVHAEDSRPTPRLSLREARAWQETSLEVEATSASTATCFKRLPTPLGSRSPEYEIPSPMVPRVSLPSALGLPGPLAPLVVTPLRVSTVRI